MQRRLTLTLGPPCREADHGAAGELRERLHALPAAVVRDALHHLYACVHGQLT